LINFQCSNETFEIMPSGVIATMYFTVIFFILLYFFTQSSYNSTTVCTFTVPVLSLDKGGGRC